MYPIGKTRFFDITGEADNDDGYVRPPEGFEWLLIYFRCRHDNVAGTTTTLSGVEENPDQKTTYISSSTLAGNAWLYLMTVNYPSSWSLPFKLTNTEYLKASVVLEAGKKLRLSYGVLERPENLELQLAEMVANRLGYRLPIASRE